MDSEVQMKEVLESFGWSCSENFWNHYYNDPWVHALANALKRTFEENQELLEELSKCKCR